MSRAQGAASRAELRRRISQQNEKANRRLIEQERSKSIIIAIDFDGVLLSKVPHNEFPRLGHDIGAIEWLLHIQTRFEVRYLLWTCRTGDHLEMATEHLSHLPVRWWAVNENPDQMCWRDDGKCSPKAYAHLTVDDTNLGIPLTGLEENPYVDWGLAGPMIESFVSHWYEQRGSR